MNEQEKQIKEWFTNKNVWGHRSEVLSISYIEKKAGMYTNELAYFLKGKYLNEKKFNFYAGQNRRLTNIGSLIEFLKYFGFKC